MSENEAFPAAFWRRTVLKARDVFAWPDFAPLDLYRLLTGRRATVAIRAAVVACGGPEDLISANLPPAMAAAVHARYGPVWGARRRQTVRQRRRGYARAVQRASAVVSPMTWPTRAAAIERATRAIEASARSARILRLYAAACAGAAELGLPATFVWDRAGSAVQKLLPPRPE